MKSAYRLVGLAAVVALSGCVSESPRYAADPNVLIVGQQAPQAPTVMMVRNGNFCTQVTETWTPSVDPASGTQIWLKQVTRVAASCQPTTAAVQ